jgi:hypothetical protein
LKNRANVEQREGEGGKERKKEKERKKVCKEERKREMKKERKFGRCIVLDYVLLTETEA